MMIMMMMMMNMMTRKLWKSRVSGFSRGKLEAGRNELGLCTARYESKRLLLVCFEGLARLSRWVWRRFVRGSREISLVPSPPYIERLPTLWYACADRGAGISTQSGRLDARGATPSLPCERLSARLAADTTISQHAEGHKTTTTSKEEVKLKYRVPVSTPDQRTGPFRINVLILTQYVIYCARHICALCVYYCRPYNSQSFKKRVTIYFQGQAGAPGRKIDNRKDNYVQQIS